MSGEFGDTSFILPEHFGNLCLFDKYCCVKISKCLLFICFANIVRANIGSYIAASTY